MSIVIVRLLLTLALGDPAGLNAVHVDKGIASLYRPWKKSRWVPYARYPGNWGVKPTPQDLVCAHRTLPFGTILRLTTSKGSPPAVCVVLDRGPFGYCLRKQGSGVKYSPQCPRGYQYVVAAGGKATVRKWEKKDGFYRGIIDATPAVHKLMRSKGWTVVRVDRLTGLGRWMHVLRLTDLEPDLFL